MSIYESQYHRSFSLRFLAQGNLDNYTTPCHGRRDNFIDLNGEPVDRTIEQFLNEIKLEGRASPAGFHWHQFYKFLQSRKTESASDPPIPLILAASGESNARKHERLAQ